MKFTAVALLALVAAVSANRAQVSNKARNVANTATNKAISQLQGLINEYGIKGANGRNLNVRSQYNQALEAAQKKYDAPEAVARREEAEAKAEWAQDQAQALRDEHSSKNLAQVLNIVGNQIGAQVNKVPNDDAQAALQSALNAALREGSRAIAGSSVAGRSLEQLKNQAIMMAKQQARAAGQPANEAQALRKANQLLNTAAKALRNL